VVVPANQRIKLGTYAVTGNSRIDMGQVTPSTPARPPVTIGAYFSRSDWEGMKFKPGPWDKPRNNTERHVDRPLVSNSTVKNGGTARGDWWCEHNHHRENKSHFVSRQSTQSTVPHPGG